MRIRIRDPLIFLTLDPGSEMKKIRNRDEKNLDPGFEMLRSRLKRLLHFTGSPGVFLSRLGFSFGEYLVSFLQSPLSPLGLNRVDGLGNS